MPFLPYKLNEYRIGLVGHFASGKTVLLTSLIDHLKWHDPATFRVGQNGEEVTHFDGAFKPDRGWEKFDYEGYRSGLNDGEWPAKNADRLQFACTYRLDANRRKSIRLKFYDIPGERMADAAMVHSSFAAWSDQMVATFQAEKVHRECVVGFIDLCRNNQPNEVDLLREYRRALARSITRFKQYISPSTFLLDVEGGQAGDADGPDTMADARYSGLPDAEFCPLPDQLRQQCPDLAMRFSNHYERYRREVVLPIMKTLANCNRLIVLVDVLGVLIGGMGMYRDNVSMAAQLFRALRPGKRFTHWASILPGIHPGGINKLACVAPMIDRVAGQPNRNNVLALLKKMLRKPTSDFPKLEKRFFVCAACESTLEGDGDTKLKAVLRKGGDFEQYAPSNVPSDWPTSTKAWPPGQYSYPEPYPQAPEAPDVPPRHIDLDELFRFLVP